MPASASFVYSLDTTAPAAPAITSVEGDTTSPAVGNDATPTIVVSGVVAGDTVTILDGGEVVGTMVVPIELPTLPGITTTVTFKRRRDRRRGDRTGLGTTPSAAPPPPPTRQENVSAGSAGFVYTVISFEGAFHPLSPDRILDTRDGNGVPAGKVDASGALSLQVTGRAACPTAASPPWS